MTAPRPYALDPRCAHVGVVDRTCHRDLPNYLDDEGRVGCVVVVRAWAYECADCGGEIRPPLGSRPVVRRDPICTAPDCDCASPSEWALIQARPFKNVLMEDWRHA